MAVNLFTPNHAYGKTSGLAVTSSVQAIVTNANSSGKVYKINSLRIANVDGINPDDVTVDVYKNQTTAYKIAHLITVPPKSSITVISRDDQIYLEENDSLRITGVAASGDLAAVCSYEEID